MTSKGWAHSLGTSSIHSHCGWAGLDPVRSWSSGTARHLSMAATKPVLQTSFSSACFWDCQTYKKLSTASVQLHVACSLPCGCARERATGSLRSSDLPSIPAPTQAWPTQGSGLGFSSTHPLILRKLQQVVWNTDQPEINFSLSPALWTPFLKFKCQNMAGFLFGVFKTHLSQEANVLCSSRLHGGGYQR